MDSGLVVERGELLYIAELLWGDLCYGRGREKSELGPWKKNANRTENNLTIIAA